MGDSTDILVPLDHGLNCPACGMLLDIVVRTQIALDRAQITGVDGLGQAISVSMHTETRPLGIIIEKHECAIKGKE